MLSMLLRYYADALNVDSFEFFRVFLYCFVRVAVMSLVLTLLHRFRLLSRLSVLCAIQFNCNQSAARPR